MNTVGGIFYMSIKQIIVKNICEYVKVKQKRINNIPLWREPLVGFADANNEDILNLKDTISLNHLVPKDVLPHPSIIIAYFLPFTKELAATNKNEGDIASVEWAYAYEETNKIFGEINKLVIEKLGELGYRGAVPKAAGTFNKEKLISDWSQRHIARAAGLGSFGINNMLITAKGCCGRYNTIVTNLDIKPDDIQPHEYCLYKKNGSCGICVKRCPSGALTHNGYNRKTCYQVCSKNARIYKDFGSSYTNEADGKPNSVGSDVCGKCVTNVPCAF